MRKLREAGMWHGIYEPLPEVVPAPAFDLLLDAGVILFGKKIPFLDAARLLEDYIEARREDITFQLADAISSALSNREHVKHRLVG